MAEQEQPRIFSAKTSPMTPDQKGSMLPRMLEKRYNETVLKTLEDRIHAIPLQRDATPTGTQASLQTYNLWGTEISSISSSQTDQIRRHKLNELIKQETKNSTPTEKEYMGIIVPELVKALVLDKEHIAQIYEQDTIAAEKIAFDWFNYPETVADTHIRIGFGGEEKMGSRIPAYLVPALRTLERVKETYGRYGNWAITNELLNIVDSQLPARLTQEDRKKELQNVNVQISNGLRSKIETKFITNDKAVEQAAKKLKKGDDKKMKLGDNEVLMELVNASYRGDILTTDEVRSVLTEVWSQYTDKPLDLEKLGEKYHFTDALPKITAFNASNTAVAINGMDQQKVQSARDNTQKLLQEYVARFHPGLEQQLIFQNDTDWEERMNNPYTRLLLQYVNHLANKMDGKREAVDVTLGHFGEHHAKAKKEIFGMTQWQAYAGLHPFFFMDKLAIEQWHEHIPAPNIMEDIPSARNIIYHQGPPEITFGVYRKIYSDEASLSDFTNWLTMKQEAIQGNFGNVAQQIEQAVSQQLTEDPTKSFKEVLGKTINTVTGQNKSAKRYFFNFINSDAFKQSNNPELEWQHFSAELHSEDPTTPEQIESLKSQLKSHQAAVKRFNMEGNDAHQKGDVQKMQNLSESDEGQFVRSIAVNKAEMVVAVGDNPVYYVQESDATIWPNMELPSLDTYKQLYEEAVKDNKTIGQIVKYTEKELLPNVLNQFDPSHDLLHAKTVNLLGTAPTKAELIDLATSNNLSKRTEKRIVSALKEEKLKDMFSQDAAVVTDLYRYIQLMMEQHKSDEDQTVFYNKTVKALLSNRISELSIASGLDQELISQYVAEEFMPIVISAAGKKLLEETKLRANQLGNSLRDYRLLLSDIDSDPEAADVKYRELLTELFSEASIESDKVALNSGYRQLPQLP